MKKPVTSTTECMNSVNLSETIRVRLSRCNHQRRGALFYVLMSIVTPDLRISQKGVYSKAAIVDSYQTTSHRHIRLLCRNEAVFLRHQTILPTTVAFAGNEPIICLTHPDELFFVFFIPLFLLVDGLFCIMVRYASGRSTEKERTRYGHRKRHDADNSGDYGETAGHRRYRRRAGRHVLTREHSRSIR